ncbi:uncharacterized protein EURHEDRAFT_410439 [Aspergillus ruber CBS 135680]|uniref:Uncharacterized protein n=1 Tax=Aspergillus ruber (strain CBS 135680) TaxID=1388766 RepID=A0A017SL55_ASPRC|nr:uncharacterized protein EURHEDRAFT_410439 [Aspergillus ruber CBS 135680]EYE97374.1 hypothetical protein EURHEDRAFT_410439 [Aspergillus ruber CBS 135680]
MTEQRHVYLHERPELCCMHSPPRDTYDACDPDKETTADRGQSQHPTMGLSCGSNISPSRHSRTVDDEA